MTTFEDKFMAVAREFLCDSHRQSRKALGAGDDETLTDAAERVVRERDEATKAHAVAASLATERLAALGAVERVLGAGASESTLDAAKRLRAERDEARRDRASAIDRLAEAGMDIAKARNALGADPGECLLDAALRLRYERGTCLGSWAITFDPDQVATLRHALREYGIRDQLVKLAEECSELAHAALKRRDMTTLVAPTHEEAADVAIVIAQVMLYDGTDLSAHIAAKVERLAKRLDGAE